MGSPLDSALANIFMCRFDSRWLPDYLDDFKPLFFRRYGDDIFALFSFPDHVKKFKEYLSSKHLKRQMALYIFQMLTFFMKTRNLQLTSIEKRP